MLKPQLLDLKGSLFEPLRSNINVIPATPKVRFLNLWGQNHNYKFNRGTDR